MKVSLGRFNSKQTSGNLFQNFVSKNPSREIEPIPIPVYTRVRSFQPQIPLIYNINFISVSKLITALMSIIITGN